MIATLVEDIEYWNEQKIKDFAKEHYWDYLMGSDFEYVKELYDELQESIDG